MSYSRFGSSRKDKTGLYMILLMIMGFIVSALGVWAVVEFILYLVKDDPFNWTSLWLLIVGFVLEIALFIKTALSD